MRKQFILNLLVGALSVGTWQTPLTEAGDKPTLPTEARHLPELCDRLIDLNRYWEAKAIAGHFRRAMPDSKPIADLIERIESKSANAKSYEVLTRWPEQPLDPKAAEIHRKLCQLKIDCQFTDLPLAQALKRVSDEGGVKIQLDEAIAGANDQL